MEHPSRLSNRHSLSSPLIPPSAPSEKWHDPPPPGAAVGLFVLSLPLAKTKLGEQLGVAAGVCFALALLLSLIAGIFFRALPATPGHADPGGIGARIGAGLSCLGALVILSLIAYAILAVRKKLFAPCITA